MAKNNFLESANGIQKTTKELLERLTLAQSSVGELLVSVRHSESELLEKEEQKRKAREERERMERLREMLDSDQDHAAHAGGRDDDELPQQKTVKAEAAAVQAPAKEAPAVEKTAEQPAAEKPAVEQAPAAAPAAEQAPAQQEAAPAAPEAPKKPANGGYEAHAIAQDDRRRPPQQQGGNYPPRQDGYQPRPQQGGNYPPRQDGYQPRPQQGGYQQRPQGGNYPPRQDGYQPRPQQGGTGPRPGQSGGFAPRGPRPAGASAPAVPAAGGKERVSNYDPNKSAYARTKEAEKKAKNKKAMSREAAPSASNWDEDATGNRKLRRGLKQPVRRPEPVVIEKAVITTETITVKDLSEKIGKPASEIIKKLFLLGMPTTINQEIDFDTC